MSKDLATYKKLIKDQNECIEALHKSQTEDQILLKTLQKENKRLREQMQMHSSMRSPTARSTTSTIQQSGHATAKNLMDRSANQTPVASMRSSGLLSPADHLPMNMEQKRVISKPKNTSTKN